VPGTSTADDPYNQAGNYWDAAPVRVYRYGPSTHTMTELPNLRALETQKREGPDPETASFEYDFSYPDDRAPHTPEEAITTGGGSKAWCVLLGDEIVIKMQKPGGAWECVFHGVALDFAIDLEPGQENAAIVCHGIAIREFDTPISGQMMRHNDDPDTVADVITDVKAAFNPAGKPNATPDGADAELNGFEFPTFLDPLVIRPTDKRRTWTLAMAARYLIYTNNAAQQFTKVPDGLTLDALLVSKIPNGPGAFDPNDPTTYTEEDIDAPDTPLSGRAWPSALFEMIRDYGFGMTWTLTTDSGGFPVTTLTLFQQQAGPMKPVYIQARGAELDRLHTNCHAVHVDRVTAQVANVWRVQGALKRYEASFILAPAFPMASADAADVATMEKYSKTSITASGTLANAYRLFVFDECGEGTYVNGTDDKDTTAGDLDSILGAGNYVRRRRRPRGELLSTDEYGKARKWRLQISTNYVNDYPGVWDGTGTWFLISGSVELCKDRIGVIVTAENPNRWNIGKCDDADHPYPLGDCTVIESLNSQHGLVPFDLLLTCVIDGDEVVEGVAEHRDASPLPWNVTRVVDARDRYFKNTVQRNSFYNPTGAEVEPRDDTIPAEAEAAAAQLMTESGRLNATFSIDHATTWYDIGDRIPQIYGRGTPLRTDAGGAGERPVVPAVVARTIGFYPEQRTVLTATDAGAGRGKFQKAIGHKARRV
jgi:hypothetical protein